MNQIQLQVLKWWHSGRNYNAGLQLFSLLTKNKTLLNTLTKKSARFGREKLNYELPKAAGLNYLRMPPLPKENKIPKPADQRKDKQLSVTENVSSSEHSKKQIELKKELEKQYPKIIRRLKYEYSNLYNERSILHKKMGYIPQNNTPQNMNDRSNLFQKISKISAEMELIHHFTQQYEKDGTIPEEKEIWPVKKEKPLPEDHAELKKIKKNLQSSISKDNNRLNYQDTKKHEKLNPIPPGPKRQKIEKRIKSRLSEIQAIEQKLIDQV
jgi:hypothetical protein